MSNTGFERLQNIIMGDMGQVFTPAVVDHAANPRNAGSIDRADAFAAMQSDCGESMEIWLRIKDERIEKIGFWSDGCGATIACGSMVGELARSKTIAEALEINEQDIVDNFGGLPEGNLHCAEFAVKTLRKAIEDYSLHRHQKSKK